MFKIIYLIICLIVGGCSFKFGSNKYSKDFLLDEKMKLLEHELRNIHFGPEPGDLKEQNIPPENRKPSNDQEVEAPTNWWVWN